MNSPTVQQGTLPPPPTSDGPPQGLGHLDGGQAHTPGASMHQHAGARARRRWSAGSSGAVGDAAAARGEEGCEDCDVDGGGGGCLLIRQGQGQGGQQVTGGDDAAGGGVGGGQESQGKGCYARQLGLPLHGGARRLKKTNAS